MSSYTQPKLLAFKATADLSAKQFHAVVFDGADDAVKASATAEAGFGILMNAPKQGQMAEVAMIGGGAKAKIGGTVARGDSLMINASGALVAATAGKKAIAVALASGVSGDIIPVELDLHTIPAST